MLFWLSDTYTYKAPDSRAPPQKKSKSYTRDRLKTWRIFSQSSSTFGEFRDMG